MPGDGSGRAEQDDDAGRPVPDDGAGRAGQDERPPARPR